MKGERFMNFKEIRELINQSKELYKVYKDNHDVEMRYLRLQCQKLGHQWSEGVSGHNSTFYKCMACDEITSSK